MATDSAGFTTRSSSGHSLAGELARAARGADAALPVLRHLLASDGPSLVNEAVVARVRGMLHDLAWQLCAGGRKPLVAPPDSMPLVDTLAERLAADSAVLAHVHALAIESHLAERFEQRMSLDPVLSPLLQELIASSDQAVAGLAMQVLTAQTRFMQRQRRMELPLEELPADLFHAICRLAGGISGPAAASGLAALKADYDEGATRLALLARLAVAMHRAVTACLSFDRAGIALFTQGVTALAGIPRAQVVLMCHEQQAVRLALALRAAGLDLAGIERQMLVMAAPAAPLLQAAELTPQQARAFLADHAAYPPAEHG